MRTAFLLSIALFVGVMSYWMVERAGLITHPSQAQATAQAPMPGHAATGTSGPGTVNVGVLAFPYAQAWRPAADHALPRRMTGNQDIQIVAGLCEAQGGSTAHDCGVGMTYLLFGQGKQFPALTSLESIFDTGFAASFPGFTKVKAQRMVSEGEVPYLRYEFTYLRGTTPYREIVAAYSTRRQGVITVASGTDASIRLRGADIKHVMAGARLR